MPSLLPPILLLPLLALLLRPAHAPPPPKPGLIEDFYWLKEGDYCVANCKLRSQTLPRGHVLPHDACMLNMLGPKRVRSLASFTFSCPSAIDHLPPPVPPFLGSPHSFAGLRPPNSLSLAVVAQGNATRTCVRDSTVGRSSANVLLQQTVMGRGSSSSRSPSPPPSSRACSSRTSRACMGAAARYGMAAPGACSVSVVCGFTFSRITPAQ